MKVTLLHHPTVGLHISGFEAADFPEFVDSGVWLGNIYRRIMPASLARVAAVLEGALAADVEILDLRLADPEREEPYRLVPWEGYQVEARRIGAPFAAADGAVARSDWVGISSHFTFESGVVGDLIRHVKKVNPAVRVLVGGADAKARPAYYAGAGADLVFTGDFNPEELRTGGPFPRVVGPYRHPFPDLIDPAFARMKHLAHYQDSHDGRVPEGVSFPIGFLYFTRGCPRECDFCESRKTIFEVLDLDHSIRMLENYRRAGIRTLNFADDNLLLVAARRGGRDHLLALLKAMRSLGFAWEYPNGLEIGRLSQDGRLDEELLEQLFSHTTDPVTGELVGAYRLYVPVETFDHRDRYRKLKPREEQNRIIGWLGRSGLPEIDFGVVLPPEADADTFAGIREGYAEIRALIEAGGQIRARYAVFHLIPIALYRSMKTKYTVEDFPEGWNFYFPVYDGAHFAAGELFERRLGLLREIDPDNYRSMKFGEYAYGRSAQDLQPA
jgi:hopanoid C-3 methylase